MSTVTLTNVTTQVRFNDVLRDIRKAGIHTKMNYSSCCRSCAQLGTDAYLAHFGGQDNAYGWLEGEMFARSAIAKAKRYYRVPSAQDKIDIIFLEFNVLETAELVTVLFRAAGFEVDWNGTESQCVQVKVS